jgi:hypothetical protein
MIYTIGHKETYLKHHEQLTKLGTPMLKAVGGSVWKTIGAAQRRAREGYAVFGVEAKWDTDTQPNDKGEWNDLLIDAPIVILPEML